VDQRDLRISEDLGEHRAGRRRIANLARPDQPAAEDPPGRRVAAQDPARPGERSRIARPVRTSARAGMNEDRPDLVVRTRIGTRPRRPPAQRRIGDQRQRLARPTGPQAMDYSSSSNVY